MGETKPQFQQGEQVASARELAAEGGWVQPSIDDAVAQLRVRCQDEIRKLNLSSNARAHALTKLEEMCFWMRAKEELS